MAITMPIKVFPQQIRTRSIIQSIWGDPEQELDFLLTSMEKDPIPATPVTRVRGNAKSSSRKYSAK